MKGLSNVYLLLTLSAVFWGANFNAGKAAVQVMTPVQAAAWRFLIAAVLILLVYWIKERPTWASLRTHLLPHIVMGFVGIFLMNICLFKGLQQTSAIHASIIVSIHPLLTVCLSALLLKEAVKARQLVGMAVSLAGVLLVLTKGSIYRLEAVSLGDLYVLLATFLWALYGIIGRKYAKEAAPLATTALTMTAGAICYLPFVSLQLAPGAAGNVAAAWLSILFMSVCCTVLAFFWWNRGIARLGTNRTALFFNIVPVSTMMISAVSGEAVGPVQIVGALAAAAGIAMASGMKRSPA